MARHPSFFRLMPTPVADESVHELVFIPHHVFLGTQKGMEEIAAALKVQRHYATPPANASRSIANVMDVFVGHAKR